MRRRGTLLASTIAVATLAWPAAVETKPRVAGVFDLTGQPKYISRGPDGNMWATISGSSDSNTLAKIAPDGDITEYQDGDIVNPIGIAPGPDNNLWLTRNGGVIKVPPGNPANAQSFDLADIGQPQKIVRGPGGRMWTASDDKLVSFLPADPVGSVEATTIDGMNARGIDVSNERLWIADFGGQRIVRATPAGATKFFNAPGGPQEVARGPGKTVAFANPGASPQRIGRIVDGKGRPKTEKVPKTDPFGLVYAKDRNWWIASFATDHMLLLSKEGDVKRFRKLPDGSGPRQIARGRKGTLWVALEGSEQIARIKGVKRKRKRR